MTENQKEKFSFRVNVRNLLSNPVRVVLDADEAERRALAERLGVDKVHKVVADLALTTWKRDGVRIKGEIKADVEQACVISLEPVKTCIDEEFEALFVPEKSKLNRGATDDNGELIIDADGPDMPETFSGDEIDVGAVCEEFVVLALDPYPRKDGATLDLPVDTSDEASESPSPFAGLENWRNANGDA
ncbi:MAG: DUF177 domain-containing protein [Pseudomonadota bacterium]